MSLLVQVVLFSFLLLNSVQIKANKVNLLSREQKETIQLLRGYVGGWRALDNKKSRILRSRRLSGLEMTSRIGAIIEHQEILTLVVVNVTGLSNFNQTFNPSTITPRELEDFVKQHIN